MDLKTLEEATKRSQRYWYEDGLTELFMGGVLGLVALSLWTEQSLPADSPWKAVGLAYPLLFIAGALGLRWGIRALKARWVFPRTGYVTYARPPSRRRWIAGLAGGLVAFVFVLLSALNRSVAVIVIPVIAGIVVGAGLGYIGYRLDLPRFYALALFSVALGLTLGLTASDSQHASMLYFGLMAIALLLSGGVVLARYLGRTRPLAES